jgi:hypothetical protein
MAIPPTFGVVVSAGVTVSKTDGPAVGVSVGETVGVTVTLGVKVGVSVEVAVVVIVAVTLTLFTVLSVLPFWFVQSNIPMIIQRIKNKANKNISVLWLSTGILGVFREISLSMEYMLNNKMNEHK